MPWETTKFPGIRIKVLYSDDDGITTALFKLDPGAVVPLHQHTALEQTFVIEGTIEDHEGVCGPGQFVWRPAGNQHEAVAPNGAVILRFFLKQNMSKWLPEVAPAPGDIKIVNTAQDRFYNTDLDKALKAKGITTIIMVGWKVSGALAYTSVGATLRDYTVVVPIDTTAAGTDYEQVIGFYQILNQGNGNLTNQPLKPKAPTLSRTDMITFQ